MLEMVDFFALVANPKAWMFFWHTIADGLATAAFLILGVSAYHLVRKQNLDFFKRSFQMARLVGLIASITGIPRRSHHGAVHVRDPADEAGGASRRIWETDAARLLLAPHHRRPDRQAARSGRSASPT